MAQRANDPLLAIREIDQSVKEAIDRAAENGTIVPVYQLASLVGDIKSLYYIAKHKIDYFPADFAENLVFAAQQTDLLIDGHVSVEEVNRRLEQRDFEIQQGIEHTPGITAPFAEGQSTADGFERVPEGVTIH